MQLQFSAVLVPILSAFRGDSPCGWYDMVLIGGIVVSKWVGLGRAVLKTASLTDVK